MSKKILLVRLDRIGDVLLSTPVIKAVKAAYPASRIAFMVRPYAREIVDGNPLLDEVIVYDKELAERGLHGNIRFILKLRKKKFDLALILHPTIRSHVVTALAGIPVRLGYDRKWGFLLTKRIPHTKQFGLKHESEYTLGLLEYLGIEAKETALSMPVNAAAEERVKKIFDRNNIKAGDRVVAINPSASCASKRWPLERFAAAAAALAERYGTKTLVISGPGDERFGDKVASLIKKECVNLSGKTSLSDVASILRRVSLFISNDSGPVHIACAVGAPVISIFGRSDRGLSPRRWGPRGDRDVALHKDVGCETCFAHNCKRGFKCLEAVTVDEVVSCAEKILGGA